MTSFRTMHRELFTDKFKMVNKFLLVYISLTLVTMLSRINTELLSNLASATSGWALILIIAVFLILLNKNDKVWHGNKYRLVPISDRSLYVANILSSFINFCYFSLIVSSISFTANYASLKSNNFDVFAFANLLTGTEKSNLVKVMFAFFVLLLVAVIFLWSSFSLIDFIADFTANFLPEKSGRIWKSILWWLTAWGFASMISSLSGPISAIVQDQSSLANDSGASSPIYIWVLLLAILSIIEYAINIYLLKNWVETDK